VPVEVAQPQLHEVAGPEPQARQEQQDGPIAPADRRRRITRRDEALDVIGR
jgi:hypothetical protein